MRVAVVGVGLIGGSVGMAARYRLGAEVRGYDADARVLELARERGAIDAPSPDLKTAVQDAELAFVAVPVGALGELIDDVLAAAPEDCVVTDVGSTKHTIVGARMDQ